MFDAINSIVLLKRLRTDLRLPLSQLKEIQRRKLKALLLHAYDNVPYYRDLFIEAGIKPLDIKGPADLLRIPTTSKLELQALPREKIICSGIDLNSCVEDVTSGSTGIPLHVYLTKEDYTTRSLIFIRTFMESGFKLTHKQAIVCDTRFVTHNKYWFQRLGFFRKVYIPVQMDLDEQIRLLNEHKPDYIHGYPNSLYAIAGELLERGITDIRPVMVCTGAELLSRKKREVINMAFGVEMVDTYATIESGMISWQCSERRGYHINIDNLVLEFLDKDGKPVVAGERGNTVVTNLNSFAMPIIRYELGDVCIPDGENCACGSGLPLMSVVEGRIDDMVYSASGKVVSPNSITNVMEAVDGISQFRIIQEDMGLLRVLLVKGKGYTSDTPETIVRLLKELAGDEFKVRVEIVAEIPVEHTGKIRAVISKINRHGKSRDTGVKSG